MLYTAFGIFPLGNFADFAWDIREVAYGASWNLVDGATVEDYWKFIRAVCGRNVLVQAATLDIQCVNRVFCSFRSVIVDNVSLASLAFIYSTNAEAMVVDHLL